MFVATNICHKKSLLWQKFCHNKRVCRDKTFVTTKRILVAVPANDSFGIVVFWRWMCFGIVVFWRWMKCCLVSSDVRWHIRDKLWPVPKHGSVNLYVHGNQNRQPRTSTLTLTQLLNYVLFFVLFVVYVVRGSYVYSGHWCLWSTSQWSCTQASNVLTSLSAQSMFICLLITRLIIIILYWYSTSTSIIWVLSAVQINKCNKTHIKIYLN